MRKDAIMALTRDGRMAAVLVDADAPMEDSC